MEYKSIPTFTKDISDRTVIGVASVFGNVDDVGDIIWPGAYQKTIAEQSRRFKHLWMHDAFSPPIASLNEIKEIGREELPEQVLADAPNALGGLLVTRTYFENERADAVFQAIKAGAINELSIGYDPVKFDFNEVDGQRVRNLRELRLYDTSDVTWGANEATANFAKALSIPPELLMQYLEAHLEELKARHSAADVKLLNAIHAAAVKLGSTQCKGIVEEEEAEKDEDEKAKSRAGGEASPLTLPAHLWSELESLELSLLT